MCIAAVAVFAVLLQFVRAKKSEQINVNAVIAFVNGHWTIFNPAVPTTVVSIVKGEARHSSIANSISPTLLTLKSWRWRDCHGAAELVYYLSIT